MRGLRYRLICSHQQALNPNPENYCEMKGGEQARQLRALSTGDGRYR